MQKNIGSKLALYPMPLLVIGTIVEKIDNTYVQEENLDESGKIDYTKFSPVLFEFPKYTYLRTGDTIGNCLRLDKEEK